MERLAATVLASKEGTAAWDKKTWRGACPKKHRVFSQSLLHSPMDKSGVSAHPNHPDRIPAVYLNFESRPQDVTFCPLFVCCSSNLELLVFRTVKSSARTHLPSILTTPTIETTLLDETSCTTSDGLPETTHASNREKAAPSVTIDPSTLLHSHSISHSAESVAQAYPSETALPSETQKWTTHIPHTSLHRISNPSPRIPANSNTQNHTPLLHCHLKHSTNSNITTPINSLHMPQTTHPTFRRNPTRIRPRPTSNITSNKNSATCSPLPHLTPPNTLQANSRVSS